MELRNENPTNFIFYQSTDGKVNVQVIVDEQSETVWATQKTLGELFGVSKSTISEHTKNIFETKELDRESTVRKIRTVQEEGERKVSRSLEFYNLDFIIALGYRVNSIQATQFRKWATGILREYLIKGFALDDERLKRGNQVFGRDYFQELLERIREIRASERLFYQKITDIYATSIDYDPKSSITQDFYATVQNKLHWAIHGHTAAELIKLRASAEHPTMGLTSWKNEKRGGKIMKSDVGIAKNYLNEKELSELNRVVTMYLDFAENMARRQLSMRMADWVNRLDAFLSFNQYEVLQDSGRVSAIEAKLKAETEFDQFRVIQDQRYESDFDRMVKEMGSKKNVD